jgi:hypothetical protein
MELSPSWDVNSPSATQECRNISLSCHRIPPLFSILSHINPVHATPSYFAKAHFIIILQLCQDLPSGLCPSGFPTKNLYSNLFGEKYKLWVSSLRSYIQPPITSYLLGLNIVPSYLFANILSLCSSFNVRDQVSHPYKTIGKIIVLHILILTFLDSRREDKIFWTEWQ